MALVQPDIRDVAQWRWREILEDVGVPSIMLRDSHGPCPICNGKDRFRFDDKEGSGSSYCNQCGARSGLGLYMAFTDTPFKESMRKIEVYLGAVPIKDPYADRNSAKPDPQEVLRRLRNTWDNAKPIRPGDPVHAYLMKRVGYVPDSPDLRFAPVLRHPDGVECPGMIARLVKGKRGAGIHRTFLTEDGRKANVSKPRMLMQTVDGLNGSSVKLYRGEPELIGIAEGIETALAAAVMFAVPFHAATSAGLMHSFIPPVYAKSILIAGDADPNYTGQNAAYGLANKMKARGLEVRVEIPGVGRDWNDVLVERGLTA